MITLGDKVKDKVSGFTGIAVSRTVYLNGCIQIGVTPKVAKTSDDIKTYYIDEPQLEIIQSKKVNVKEKETGGPTRRSPLNTNRR